MRDSQPADPTRRFSGRVQDYVAHRPSYPPALLDLLRDELRLAVDDAVADVGSGPGTLSRLLLENGNTVFAVEPNDEMRAAAEEMLAGYERFRSVAGRAEATGLQSASVDFIVAGQAFHWFEPAATRKEFERILKPGGWVVLIWNQRRTEGEPFLEAYEEFLVRWGTDYKEVSQRYAVEPTLDAFFAPHGYEVRSFVNSQALDFEGLCGRVLSSSYMPDADHPDRPRLRDALRELFEEHRQTERVVLEYDTRVYFGRLLA